MKAKDTILTDEEIIKMRSEWLTTDCPDEETATQIALARLRGLLEAQAEITFKEGQKEGKKEVVELALKSINDEPEFPGEMPDELWSHLDGDKDKVVVSMRASVRLTKKGIIERLQENLKDWRI